MEEKDKEILENEKKRLKKYQEISAILILIIVIAVLVAFFMIVFYNAHSHADKPIIYLYPEKDMEVSVKLGQPEQITCS